MSWTERTSNNEEPVSTGMIGVLRHMVNNADANVVAPPPGGGKLRTQGKDITLYTGGDEGAFEKLIRTLSTLLGAPLENMTEKTPSGEVEGHRLSFPGDISIVSMPFRDNGISINIPKKSLPLVSEKLLQYEAGLSGGTGSSITSAF